MVSSKQLETHKNAQNSFKKKGIMQFLIWMNMIVDECRNYAHISNESRTVKKKRKRTKKNKYLTAKLLNLIEAPRVRGFCT